MILGQMFMVIFRQYYRWMISHTGECRGYIDMSLDKELGPDQLPRGYTPIWIQAPKDASQIEMMERVLMIPELKQYNENVTVLSTWIEDTLKEMCGNLGYKNISATKSYGVEDQVVILLDTDPNPETITRAINMLIIVTNGR